jgi:AcrR family transcriptional regulator
MSPRHYTGSVDRTAGLTVGADGVIVARVKSRGIGNSVGRVTYREAARTLLRDAVLDAMHDLLLTQPWPSIKLSDVASAAGVSRQTIYKEFGSRQGLAQGYALRLADRFVDVVREAIDANVGDINAAFTQGFRDFFMQAAADPLVVSLVTGAAKPDLLRIVTTDSGPIIARASQRLVPVLTGAWVKSLDEDAGILARAIVRLAMSYISMPPADNNDVAADLARLLTPAVQAYGVIETD